MKKKILQYIVKFFARRIVRKYQPIVIGITGSVGKTTTKDALDFAFSQYFHTRSTSKNFNNEIGVPLTIIGVTEEPGRSVIRWISVFWNACFQIMISRVYPKVLILEMGVDRPGDMSYLLSIVEPDISIVTGISSSHIEFFGSRDAIAQEKGKIVECVDKEGYAILNADDPRTWAMRKRTQAHIITYGFGKRSTLRAFNDSFLFEKDGFDGMALKVEYKENIIPVRLKKVIARHHVEALLATMATGDALGINFIDVARKLESFMPSQGRFRIISGILGSTLIDDTYNASPISTHAALISLKDFKKNKTLAILGDMLELGSEEEGSHRELAKSIEKNEIDRVILIGNRMKYLFEELQNRGFQEVFLVGIHKEAIELAKKYINSESIVLIKGSQGMRMEFVVEGLMAHPEKAQELLCRQSGAWKRKSFIRP